MMKLTCKDMDPNSTCDFEATGNSASEVASNMMTHAKEAHPENMTSMSEVDMMNAMEAKVHN